MKGAAPVPPSAIRTPSRRRTVTAGMSHHFLFRIINRSRSLKKPASCWNSEFGFIACFSPAETTPRAGYPPGPASPPMLSYHVGYQPRTAARSLSAAAGGDEGGLRPEPSHPQLG